MDNLLNEYFEFLCEAKDCGLYKLINTNLYCIIRTINNIKNLIGTKNLNKPSFSYYKSLEAIKIEGKLDPRVEPFPDKSIVVYDENNVEYDNEIIVLEEELELSRVKIIFNAIASYEDAKSLYEIIVDLEDIFGLILKFAKKNESNIVASLVFIKHYEKYIEQIQLGWNLKIENNNLIDEPDFIFNTKDNNIITMNLNSVFSESRNFSVNNEQFKLKNQHYIVAIRLYEVPEGFNILKLIDWYLDNEYCDLRYAAVLRTIRENCDERFVKNYDPKNVQIRIIESNKIPYIEQYPDNIYKIKFETNLMELDSTDLEDIIEKIK